MQTNDQLQAENDALRARIELLEKTIEVQKEQMRRQGGGAEMRRLREKIGEWEGSTRKINGGFYHRDRFIRPYQDNPDE